MVEYNEPSFAHSRYRFESAEHAIHAFPQLHCGRLMGQCHDAPGHD